MKTVDFLDFFEFKNNAKGRGRKIEDNQCSVLINDKNNTYYFRFPKDNYGYNKLKIGKSNGNIYFVLNKIEGIEGKSHSNSSSNTMSFANKEAVITMLNILYPNYNKKHHKCIFEFEIVDRNADEKVLRFIKVK